jgi:hypothetical protein
VDQAGALTDQEITPIPARVDLDRLQKIIDERRREYTHTYVDNDVLEALITEARLYRNRYDPAARRQRDAKQAQRTARKRWD